MSLTNQRTIAQLRQACLPVGLVALMLSISACGGGRRLPSINGAGASFPAPAYQRWAADYK
ncbi:phosphate ABC transporter substrate-binding protein PstS, partial [Cyanobium sp. N5-Cardenillas]|nr:phosphate ABC transporter substrate-binding protein PstS [Cyanobium sp. N5-Cardenillas]